MFHLSTDIMTFGISLDNVTKFLLSDWNHWIEPEYKSKGNPACDDG